MHGLTYSLYHPEGKRVYLYALIVCVIHVCKNIEVELDTNDSNVTKSNAGPPQNGQSVRCLRLATFYTGLRTGTFG